MTDDTRSKLLPRNVAALRRFQDPAAAPREVTGNPVMTRLESGIGNCFPGLECDLRNLERRFFPFLEIEINFSVAQGIMQVAAVDLPGVEAAGPQMRRTTGLSHRICATEPGGSSATSPATSGRSSSSPSIRMT